MPFIPDAVLSELILAWDRGSSSNPHIKRDMHAIARVIWDQAITLDPYDGIQWVVTQEVARGMAESAEVHEYLKGLEDWMRWSLLQKGHPNSRFGLPDKLYGFGIIIEGHGNQAVCRFSNTVVEWQGSERVLRNKGGEVIATIENVLSRKVLL